MPNSPVAVQQDMKEIWNKKALKNIPTHLNPYCLKTFVPIYSVSVKSSFLNLLTHYYQVFARLTLISGTLCVLLVYVPRNLEIALRILRIPRLRNTLARSWDCATIVRNLQDRSMPPMEVDTAYQGCLPSCELHNRSLTVRRTVACGSWDCAHALHNLEIAQIPRLRGTYT